MSSRLPFLAGIGTQKPEGSDTELIARVKDGHERAFEQWFRRNSGEVLNFVIYKLNLYGLAAGAEDVAQEALVRAWQRRKSFKGDSSTSFLNWVKAISSRLCIDLVRKTGRQRTIHAEFLEAVLGDAQYSDPQHIPLADNELDLLFAVLGRLSPQEKEVIVEFMDGLSDSEVAAKLGKTTNQVNGLKFRAIRKLRKRLSPDPFQEPTEEL